MQCLKTVCLEPGTHGILSVILSLLLAIDAREREVRHSGGLHWKSLVLRAVSVRSHTQIRESSRLSILLSAAEGLQLACWHLAVRTACCAAPSLERASSHQVRAVVWRADGAV
ncbi:hypothetical protein MRX96_002448 [Rhipicephalus microplus]